MQRWSFSHVDFCAGGGRFRNALVCYSFTVAHHHVVPCIVVLLTEFAPSLVSSALEKLKTK